MSDEPIRYPWSRRLFRILLMAYPAAVRQQCGVEMWMTFRDRISAARHGSRTGFLRLWLMEIGAGLWNGCRERWQARGMPGTKVTSEVRKGDSGMQAFIEDIRYGFRTLTKSRSFTTVAVLTLALGIGANTSIFSLVSGILFFPFGFDEPDRVVQIRTLNQTIAVPNFVATSLPEFIDWKEQSKSFEFISANRGASFNLTGGEEPVRASGVRVTSEYFSVFAVDPVLGRAFLPGEDLPGADPVVIVTEGLWERELASDHEVLGKTLTLDGVSHTVIGVLPSDFALSLGTDVYVPLTLDPNESDRGNRNLVANARLADGVLPDQARAEFQTIASRLAEEYPETNEGWAIEIQTWPELLLNGNTAIIMAMLQGAVLFVLLIGCVNVSNLMLARMSSRNSEVSIRVAMGAGRLRLVRQFLTEGILLSLAGAIGGLVLSVWGISFLRGSFAAAPGTQLMGRAMQIDWKVLLFTLSLSVVSTLFFALVPAWRGSRADLHGALKESGHRSGGSSHGRLRTALVFSEVAMAGVLLITAGVMINSVIKVRTADPGFNMDSVLTMRTSLSEDEYPDDPQVRNFGSSAEFVGKTVFHRRLRRPRCSPSLKASLASSAAAPALTLGCAPRCRLVWAMGNGASGGGSGHRV